MTNDSYEYIVCGKLYRIRYLLNYFINTHKPCYCKAKIYEYSSVFAGKFMIHTLYMVDNGIIPDKVGIFNKYYEYVGSHASVSEFLTKITNAVVNFYYDFVYDEYVLGLRYLFENHDPEFFSNFIDMIIEKFFENILIVISGFNIKCYDSCIDMCKNCSSADNKIRFYMFDEFVHNSDKLIDLIDIVKSRLDCSKIDIVIDGKFLSDSYCDVMKKVYDYAKNTFRSISVSKINCDLSS